MSVVYYIQPTCNLFSNHFKIGWTSNLQQRLKKYGKDSRILSIQPTFDKLDRSLETLIKQIFRIHFQCVVTNSKQIETFIGNEKLLGEIFETIIYLYDISNSNIDNAINRKFSYIDTENLQYNNLDELLNPNISPIDTKKNVSTNYNSDTNTKTNITESSSSSSSSLSDCEPMDEDYKESSEDDSD